MQRTEDGKVIISCDFCSSDWDEVKPMIEGHHGSVLCLNCLRVALVERSQLVGQYACTMCIQEDLPQTLPRWVSPIHEQAVACEDCLIQAAKAFDRDRSVDWSWDQAASGS